MRTREATGGNYPKIIADFAHNDTGNCTNIHLFLVTDGEVNSSEIQEWNKLIKQYKFKFGYVSSYIIGDNDNYSVGAPFIIKRLYEYEK